MSEELTNIEIIVFEDENGEDIEMNIVDEFDHENIHYVALTPAQIDADDEEDSINFFSVSKVEGQEEFDLVEDEKLLNTLFDLLEDRLVSSPKA